MQSVSDLPSFFPHLSPPSIIRIPSSTLAAMGFSRSMLACSSMPAGVLSMHAVGQHDVDRIHFRIGRQIVKVGVVVEALGFTP